MAITLPLPLRVAAGILGAGIDRVRALPEDIPALPVSLVGNAMRLSMKVQQEIASLATRGDELLGGMISAPQEHPSWAKFDDDEPAPPPRPRSTMGRTLRSTTDPTTTDLTTIDLTTTELTTTDLTATDLTATDLTAAASGPDRAEDTRLDASAGTNGGDHHLKTPETTSLAPDITTAMAAAVEMPPAVVEQALIAAADADQLPDEQQADAVIDGIVDAVEEAAAQLQEALVEEAAQELAEEVEVAVQQALEEAAEQSLEEAVENAAEQFALAAALEEVFEQESVLGDAIVVAATEEAVLEEQLDAVVREHADEEAVLEEAIAESVLAEAVLEDALEETLDQQAVIEAALDENALDEPASQEAGTPTVVSAAAAALPLAGFDRLSLAQVRGHLRELSADDVAALLQYERDTENRPPFLTLLTNRIVTLDAQNP